MDRSLHALECTMTKVARRIVKRRVNIPAILGKLVELQGD